MKKLFLVIAVIILIIIAVPLINSKDSAMPKNFNFEDSKEIEKHIVKLVDDEDIDIGDKSKIIKALPDINWDNLNEKEEEELKTNMAIWIYNMEIENKEEIDAIIKILDNFNEEDKEKIIEKLVEEYEEDMDKFIIALSHNEDRLDDLGYYFYDLELYETNGRSLSEDFLYISDSKELNDEEKKIGYKFLEIIASCDT